MSVYTVEETDNGVWSIIDDNRGLTGSKVLGLQSKEAANFYCQMMNLVYKRAMDDMSYKIERAINENM